MVRTYFGPSQLSSEPRWYHTLFQRSISDGEPATAPLFYYYSALELYRYARADTLAGLLYFHRISDRGTTGSQTRNFRTLRSLWGDETLKNVAIVTNMWSRVELEVGKERETQLMSKDIFFKPALDNGAQMARHGNTISSAQGISASSTIARYRCRSKGSSPMKTRMSSTPKPDGNLDQELNDEARKSQEEIRVLAAKMERVDREMDEETRNELEIETRRMHEQIRSLKAEAQNLVPDYLGEERGFQARLAELGREMQERDCGAGYTQHSVPTEIIVRPHTHWYRKIFLSKGWQ